jgi:hypothetical protein
VWLPDSPRLGQLPISTGNQRLPSLLVNFENTAQFSQSPERTKLQKQLPHRSHPEFPSP